jgi:ATP-dependent DNA helicase RecG
MARMKVQESETVEFKELWSDTALEALAAFANHKGGKLYVGVRNDGEIVGLAATDADQQRIVNQIVLALGLRPAVEWETHGRKRLLCFHVEPTTIPTAYRGRYFVRVGSTNRDMAPDQVGRRFMMKLGETWDALPSRFALDAINIDAFRKFARLAKVRLPRLGEDDPPADVLANLGLIHDGVLTKGAMLLFGKEPQYVATAAQIHIGRFKGGLTLDDRFIAGTLWNQLDSVLEAFRGYLQIRSEVKSTALTVEGIQRHETWEYPLDALREATVNALIHRDYTIPGDIQIRVEEDRIHFWNPGRLPEGITLPDLLKEQHASSLRNPLLARTFFFAELVETWGSGTTRMRNLCRKQGLPEPQFSETGGGFSVVFAKDTLTPERLASLGLNDRQVRAVAALKSKPNGISNAEYQRLTEASKRTASRDLDDLEARGIVARVGRGRVTRYRLIGP